MDAYVLRKPDKSVWKNLCSHDSWELIKIFVEEEFIGNIDHIDIDDFDVQVLWNIWKKNGWRLEKIKQKRKEN